MSASTCSSSISTEGLSRSKALRSSVVEAERGYLRLGYTAAMAGPANPPSADDALSSTVSCLYQFALDPTAWFENQARWLEVTDSHDPSDIDVQALLPHLMAIEAVAASTPPSKAPEAGTIGIVLLSANGSLINANGHALHVLEPLNVELHPGDVPTWPGPGGAESLAPYIAELSSGRLTVVVPLRSLGKIVLGLLSRTSTVRDRLGRTDDAARSRYSLLLPGESFNDESLGWLRSRGLTETESNVAIRIGAGLSPQEVATELGSSINTVRTHVRAIFDKLGVNRQAELIKAVSDLAVLGQWLDATDAPEEPGSGPSVLVPRELHTLPDGRQLAYRRYGHPAGVAAAFFHSGWGHTLITADQERLLLDAGVLYIAVDRPGFGHSDRLQPYSGEQVAADMLDLLKALAIERCVLVGAASGIRFALQTALEAQRDEGVEVAGVIGIAARKGKASFSAPESSNLFVRHYLRLARNPALIETFARLIASPSRRFIWRRMVRLAFGRGFDQLDPVSREQIHQHTVRSALDATERSSFGISDELSLLVKETETPISELKCPVQFWRGELDDLTSHADVERYLATTARGTLHSVPGAGTLIEFSHFSVIVAAMTDLLGSAEHSTGNATG